MFLNCGHFLSVDVRMLKFAPKMFGHFIKTYVMFQKNRLKNKQLINSVQL